jgi:hypothetical protein
LVVEGGRIKLIVSGEREATGARTVLLGFNRSCSSLHKTDGKKKETTWLPMMKSERIDKICKEMR